MRGSRGTSRGRGTADRTTDLVVAELIIQDLIATIERLGSDGRAEIAATWAVTLARSEDPRAAAYWQAQLALVNLVRQWQGDPQGPETRADAQPCGCTGEERCPQHAQAAGIRRGRWPKPTR